MKNTRVPTPHGPLILLNSNSEKNTLWLDADPEPNSLNGRKDSDLLLCLAVLPTAKAGGFNEIAVMRKGSRTHRYTLAEVERHGVALRPQHSPVRLGNVEEGDPMGINIAPGAHFSITEHQKAVQAERKIIVNP